MRDRKKQTYESKKYNRNWYLENRDKKIAQVKANNSGYVFEDGTSIPENHEVFDNNAPVKRKCWILDEEGKEIPVITLNAYRIKKTREKKWMIELEQINASNKTSSNDNKSNSKSTQSISKKRDNSNSICLTDDRVVKKNKIDVKNVNCNDGYESTIENIIEQNTIKESNQIDFFQNQGIACEYSFESGGINVLGFSNNINFNSQELNFELNDNNGDELGYLNDINSLFDTDNTEPLFYQNDLLSDQLFFGENKKNVSLLDDEFELMPSPEKR